MTPSHILSDGVTISPLVKRVLDGIDPVGTLLLSCQGQSAISTAGRHREMANEASARPASRPSVGVTALAQQTASQPRLRRHRLAQISANHRNPGKAVAVSDATSTPRWSRNRKDGAQLPALSARSARRAAIRYSVALRIASAASRLLGFVAGREAAAGVFLLFLMSGLPSAHGDQ